LNAAWLWAGEDSAISHLSAAAFLRLVDRPPNCVDITVLSHIRSPAAWLRVHRVKSLGAPDVVLERGIRVTSPCRTILDAASVLTEGELGVAVDEALRRGLLSVQKLRWFLDQNTPRRGPGVTKVRRLLEQRIPGPVPESVLETKFVQLLRRNRLPVPVPQFEVRLEGRFIARVDFAYPDIRLAVEVDGFRYHSSRKAWERDIDRANALLQAGWRIIRFTWADIAERPRLVATQLAEILEKLRLGRS
jgi:very-short-patch-repair endonuclease